MVEPARAEQIKWLSVATAKLETAVSGIKKNVQTAQNVVKVVG